MEQISIQPLLLLPLYLDPGSGSFIIQLILAGALGLGLGIRMYWSKLVSLVTGKKKDAGPEAGENKDED